MRFIKNYILLTAILFPAFFYGQFYYGSQQEFGKSRVQYQPFYWTYYNFDNYQVYFYEGCRDIARYVALRTDYHLKDLQKNLIIKQTLSFKYWFIAIKEILDKLIWAYQPT